MNIVPADSVRPHKHRNLKRKAVRTSSYLLKHFVHIADSSGTAFAHTADTAGTAAA